MSKAQPEATVCSRSLHEELLWAFGQQDTDIRVHP